MSLTFAVRYRQTEWLMSEWVLDLAKTPEPEPDSYLIIKQQVNHFDMANSGRVCRMARNRDTAASEYKLGHRC